MVSSILDFPPDQLIRRVMRFVSTSTGVEYFNDTPVKSGYIHILTRVAVENLNHAYTRFRLGIWGGGAFHLFEEQKSPAATTLYWTVDPIYLTENKNLRLEVYGCTVGDVIMVYIDGFFRVMREEKVNA